MHTVIQSDNQVKVYYAASERHARQLVIKNEFHSLDTNVTGVRQSVANIGYRLCDTSG